MLAVFHPVLAHCATCVWREVFERCRIAGWCGHHHGVFECTKLTQRLHRLGNRRALLADGYIDALHTESALVDDGVDGDSGLARLAVTDDQLALTATDRGHRVDGLDAGLQRLVHGLAAHDARGLHFYAARDCTDDVALAVDRLAECVHYAAEHRIANGHRKDATRGLHWLTFGDVVGIAEHHGADGLFFEVERQAHHAAFELEQLVHRAVGQAAHAGDAVAHFDHATNRAGLYRRRVALETLGDRCRDFARGESQFSHVCSFREFRSGSSIDRDVCARCRRSLRRQPRQRDHRARSDRRRLSG